MSRLPYHLLVFSCLLLPACGQPYGDTPAGPAEAAGAATDETSAPAGDASDAAPAADSADADAIELTADNTQIQFVGTHTGDEPKPRTGVFTEFSGQASVDREAGVLKSASVDIQVESLVTPFDKLTNHLKSPDFFDVREYPTAKFESTSVEADEETGEQVLIGNLTLMGTTKEVRFPVDVTVSGDEVTVAGRITINRSEYGMDKMMDGVNDEVEIAVAIGQPTVIPQAAEPN